MTVNYFDGTLFMPKQVTAKLPDGTDTQPAELDLFGVTDYTQAWREGIYMAAANRYRRKLISFETELEGHIPTVGDLVAVSHDMPQWGLSGDVTAC